MAEVGRLEGGEVERLLVFEGNWPEGEPRIVEDPEKITLFVESLKTGKRYLPDHDRNNGFECVVFIEPQHLQFRAYQREEDPHSVIVGLGEWGRADFRSFGYIQCELPKAWTQL